MMEIRLANISDYDRVRRFYHSLADEYQAMGWDIGWKKDIYPAPDFLKSSICAGELYIGCEEAGIAAAMVVNRQCNEGYQGVKWPTKAMPDEVAFLHALGVHPDFTRKGFAKQLVLKAIDLAARRGLKAIRLDVLEGNLPAEHLYVGLGFKYVHTLCMFYEDTGWTYFKLYEYAL